jgi:hypothetical protein
MITEAVFSTVRSVQADGTWESKHGVLYSYEYTMDDGVSFKANHKSPTNAFKVGDHCTYSITKENQYGKLGKIRHADYEKPDKFQYNKPTSTKGDDGLKGVKIGHAITNAVSLVCATGLVKDGDKSLSLKKSIKTYAELILQISEELANPGQANVSEKVQNVAKQLDAEVTSTEKVESGLSDLPF